MNCKLSDISASGARSAVVLSSVHEPLQERMLFTSTLTTNFATKDVTTSRPRCPIV